jgi:NAD+ kinase
MRVDVDDETISTRVLNDALFCHVSPAAATRYWIQQGDVREQQLSSGIWVGPAAGSTAAQRSAGGKVLPLKSQKLQFVAREPYRGADSGYRLARGLVSSGDALRLTSIIRDGRLFLDGAQKVHAVALGAVVSMSRSEEPLTLLGLHDTERG